MSTVAQLIFFSVRQSFGDQPRRVLLCFLAFNRFSAVVFFKKYKLIFNSKLMYVLISLSFICGLIYTLSFFYCAILDNFKSFVNFVQNPPKVCDPITKVIKEVNLCVTWIVYCFEFSLYLSAFAISFWKRKNFIAPNNQYKIELKLMLSTFYSAVFTVSGSIIYFYYPQFISTTEFALIGYFITPVFYIMFDKNIRNCLLKFIHISCLAKVSPSGGT